MININANGLEAKLDRIIELLEGLGAPTQHAPVEMALGTLEQPDNQNAAAVKVEEEAPVEENSEELLASISALIRKLCSPQAGKRAEAKATVEEYAPNVSSIPKDKLAEVLARLEVLDNGA